jgi:hypothetical protein
MRVKIYYQDNRQDVEEWKDLKNAMSQGKDSGEDGADNGSCNDKKAQHLLILTG